MSVVRMSRGAFAPEFYEAVTQFLDESQNSLVPGIRELSGCLGFWAGTDRESNTMINVSVWASLEEARQLDTFAPMLALAKEFTRRGVQFERPITHYDVLWTIP